jgi:hypothetical protein
MDGFAVGTFGVGGFAGSGKGGRLLPASGDEVVPAVGTRGWGRGSGLAAILLAAANGGRDGLRELLARLFTWRVNVK